MIYIICVINSWLHFYTYHLITLSHLLYILTPLITSYYHWQKSSKTVSYWMIKIVNLWNPTHKKKFTYITFLPCFLKHCIDSLLTVCSDWNMQLFLNRHMVALDRILKVYCWVFYKTQQNDLNKIKINIHSFNHFAVCLTTGP